MAKLVQQASVLSHSTVGHSLNHASAVSNWERSIGTRARVRPIADTTFALCAYIASVSGKKKKKIIKQNQKTERVLATRTFYSPAGRDVREFDKFYVVGSTENYDELKTSLSRRESI